MRRKKNVTSVTQTRTLKFHKKLVEFKNLNLYGLYQLCTLIFRLVTVFLKLLILQNLTLWLFSREGKKGKELNRRVKKSSR